ncbi:MAG: T9SS type A sorting domain-containing protein [Saprospirales bacterium]|nr:T9SS type A sorting domain-containing protein [Saprospirales bacterium]
MIKKIKDVFYYYSYDTINFPFPTTDSATFTAYNFDGTELRTTNDSVGIDNYFLNSICNIENSLVLYYNNNSRIGFKVLDTLFNVVMQGLVDTASYPPNYFYNAATKFNIHIIDTNHYCVLQSIWQDTISGCYPNTDNIVFSAFSKNDVISSVKHHTTSDFLSIYPNPNNGNFTIDFSSKGNYPITISLFDVTGKIVYQQTILHNDKSLISINEEILASGLYNIQISSANDVWNKKVLITK